MSLDEDVKILSRGDYDPRLWFPRLCGPDLIKLHVCCMGFAESHVGNVLGSSRLYKRLQRALIVNWIVHLGYNSDVASASVCPSFAMYTRCLMYIMKQWTFKKKKEKNNREIQILGYNLQFRAIDLNLNMVPRNLLLVDRHKHAS